MFTFSTTLDDESNYEVTILTRPTSPNQTCSVTTSTGTLAGANITNVSVICTTKTYTVGGSLSGLAAGNSVVLQNNAGDDLTIGADEIFTFPTAIDDETTYDITVLVQPTTPNQTCVVTNANNTLAGSDITNIIVTCTTNTYSIGGTISGLATGNEVILQNNIGDNLTVNTNGLFTFSTTIDDESSYDITILTQPTTPNQTCNMTSAIGTLAGATITNVSVICTTNTYTVGGSLSGLAAGNSVVLQNNAGDDLTIGTDGIFAFATAIDDGTTYDITVLAQPTIPNQTCIVTNTSGVLAGSDITDITVACTINNYTIGGTISGLGTGNEVILQNNFGDDLTINVNGSFTFATALGDESAFELTVLTQPLSPNQTCAISDGVGQITGVDIENVSVYCNTEPTAIADDYSTNEDTFLIANSSNSIFGVLDNDLDSDNDTLNIESPGTYNLGGIGGTIIIEANGNFNYTPPIDLFGQATFDFVITDGTHTVSSSLNINVLPVNDAPEFSIMGDIRNVNQLNPDNNIVDIPNFASHFVFGPNNESDQQVQAFNTVVVSDSSFILNDVNTATNGILRLDFTDNNYGLAIILIKMQDNGGMENGGEDISTSHEFFVVSDDIIFADGFGGIDVGLLDFVGSLVNRSSLNSVIYDYDNDAIQFYDHVFYLNGDYSFRTLQILKLWLREILILEDPMGDYDQDEILNDQDLESFSSTI